MTMLWSTRCWIRTARDGRHGLCGETATGWNSDGALVCDKHEPVAPLEKRPLGFGPITSALFGKQDVDGFFEKAILGQLEGAK